VVGHRLQVASSYPSTGIAASAVRVTLNVLRLPPAPSFWESTGSLITGAVRITGSLRSAGGGESAVTVISAKVRFQFLLSSHFLSTLLLKQRYVRASSSLIFVIHSRPPWAVSDWRARRGK
jgi:hypothetical protein